MDTSDLIALLAATGTVAGAIIAWLAFKKKESNKDEGQHNNQHNTFSNITGSTTFLSGDNTGTISNISVLNQELQKVNFPEEDQRNEWKIYEVAFLWHDYEPPASEAHFNKMTRKVEETKAMLHLAAEEGELLLSREISIENVGLTRFVSRQSLIEFCNKNNYQPAFLFPSARAN